MRQLTLFGDELTPKKKMLGGSRNPIVFNDYDAFLAKFTDNPKTTDECWTPRDVYEAVLTFVGEICDLTDKVVLRPFFPGGDYEAADYPANGIVVDNPPFSIFTKICKFYSERKIPFFLFGPGLTISSCCRYCTAVIVADQLTFTNGAKVKCNFATNLMGDTLITTAIRLQELLSACPSQNQKVNLPKYNYPPDLLSVSDFQTISKGNQDFAVSRHEAIIVKKLDHHPKELFGEHFLVRKAAARKAAARKAIDIPLSCREINILKQLNSL